MSEDGIAQGGVMRGWLGLDGLLLSPRLPPFELQSGHRILGLPLALLLPRSAECFFLTRLPLGGLLASLALSLLGAPLPLLGLLAGDPLGLFLAPLPVSGPIVDGLHDAGLPPVRPWHHAG